jgi:nucleoside-diphosphate-sugar epimerase
LPCAPAEVDDWLGTPPAGVVATVARTPGPFLVLGAGGKMGLHLALMLRRALDALGRADRVVAVSRFTALRGRAAFEARRIETIACDLTAPAALDALPEAAAVFFLAGVKFGTAALPGLLHTVNAELPRRVAARYARARIVAFSSGCVYPFVATTSRGADESVPPAPTGAYAESCVARERAFAEGAAAHGTPVAILRLNYATEFRYGLLVDLAQRVLAGQSVDVTTSHANVIWQSDAVAHAVRALELAAAPALTLNLAGPEIFGIGAVAQRFGELLARPVTLTGTPTDTAWLSDAARAHARFGPPAVSLAQMIGWTAAWLRHGGATWDRPTAYERRDGRF